MNNPVPFAHWLRRALVRLFCGVLILATILLPTVTAAQDDLEQDRLKLTLRRNFGFGLGQLAQGTFSCRVSGPEELLRVDFLLDDQLIGQDSDPPFQLTFQTSDFDLGPHKLSAIGHTADGRTLDSNVLARQFVPGGFVRWFVLAIVGLVVLFRLVSYLLTRQRSGSSSPSGRTSYGYLGGTVCPNCGRPYALHWWSLRLVSVRLDRCLHCGKWKVVQRASPQALADAEQFAQELEGKAVTRPASTTGNEERLRRQLDDSRYQDE